MKKLFAFLMAALLFISPVMPIAASDNDISPLSDEYQVSFQYESIIPFIEYRFTFTDPLGISRVFDISIPEDCFYFIGRFYFDDDNKFYCTFYFFNDDSQYDRYSGNITGKCYRFLRSGSVNEYTALTLTSATYNTYIASTSQDYFYVSNFENVFRNESYLVSESHSSLVYDSQIVTFPRDIIEPEPSYTINDIYLLLRSFFIFMIFVDLLLFIFWLFWR